MDFPIEFGVEELKDALEVIRENSSKIDEKIEAKKEEIKATTSRIDEQRSKLDKERKILRIKLARINQRVLHKFTNDECYPSYSKDYYRGLCTNIRRDVLEAIKKTIGISKLMNSQVARLVRNMMDKEFAKCRKRIEFRDRLEDIRGKESRLYKEERELETSSGLRALKIQHMHCHRLRCGLLRRINHPKTWQKSLKLQATRRFAMSPEGTNKVYDYLMESRKK